MTDYFFKDLLAARDIKLFWLKLSWLEFYGWYSRLNFGLAWVIISPAIFALGISVVYAEAFEVRFWQHFLYVYSGYICWLFISDTMSAGAEVYNASYSYYSETRLPLIGFNIKGTLVRAYALLLNTAVFVVVALFSEVLANPWVLLIVIPYFLVMSMLVSVFLSILLAYLPDLKLVIQNIMRMLFFLTPIVWVPDDNMTGVKAILVYANPFYYMVDGYRQIMAEQPNYQNEMVYLIMLVIISLLAIFSYNKYSRRMVFICN